MGKFAKVKHLKSTLKRPQHFDESMWRVLLFAEEQYSAPNKPSTLNPKLSVKYKP